MKYLVLLIGDGDMPAWDSQSPEEQAAAMQRFADFDAACEAREGVQILAGEALSDGASATVMTTRSGKVTLTEGPYAERSEERRVGKECRSGWGGCEGEKNREGKRGEEGGGPGRGGG